MRESGGNYAGIVWEMRGNYSALMVSHMREYAGKEGKALSISCRIRIAWRLLIPGKYSFVAIIVLTEAGHARAIAMMSWMGYGSTKSGMSASSPILSSIFSSRISQTRFPVFATFWNPERTTPDADSTKEKTILSVLERILIFTLSYPRAFSIISASSFPEMLMMRPDAFVLMSFLMVLVGYEENEYGADDPAGANGNQAVYEMVLHVIFFLKYTLSCVFRFL